MAILKRGEWCMERVVGQVYRVNGPVIEVMGVKEAMMFELVRVGEQHLVGEIIKLERERAIIQVYEDTTGIAPLDPVYGSGMPLSVELGPGLIGTIYGGIQRPLEDIRNLSGEYIERGIQLPSLNRNVRWEFHPLLSPDDQVSGGTVIGTVQATERVEQRIMVPPGLEGVIEFIVPGGEYAVDEPVARMRTEDGVSELFLLHRWPIRRPRPVRRRLPPDLPLITGQRVIDTLFPVAKGGRLPCRAGLGQARP